MEINNNDPQWYAVFYKNTRNVAYLIQYNTSLPLSGGEFPLSLDDYQKVSGILSGQRGVNITEAGEITAYDPPKTLSGQRSELATLTTQKKALGVYFQPSGTSAAVLFPSDDASYANALQQAQVVQLGAWTDGTAWTLADGSSVPMTSDDVTGLFKKLAKYRGACQTHSAALSKQLESDLNADLTTGWPDNH